MGAFLTLIGNLLGMGGGGAVAGSHPAIKQPTRAVVATSRTNLAVSPSRTSVTITS